MKTVTKFKFILMLAIMINFIFFNSQKVYAENTINNISLSDKLITLNGEQMPTDSSNGIYLSNFMNNGGTSQDSLKSNKEISNVINIHKSGTYKFEGNLSDGQISINSNDIKGNLIIILNNVNITCKKAPAIFVYNKETNSTDCNITIQTEKETINTITGGKLKQDVEGWKDQEKILYYIDKGNDDDGTYYEQYKYDAAISSDISLNFEGEGTLTINSTEKEGIETKRNITINSGSYIINSLDDGINASTDGESVITINGGSVLVNLKEESEEGDGIDSNGSLIINGGKVFAFANETSQDSGLDSDLGIFINGGHVVGIGNMSDSVSKESKQNYIQMQFNSKVEKNNLITIVDESSNPIIAFKSDREYTVLVLSMPELENKQYSAYEGGTIDGKNENGLYTEITSYEQGTIRETSNLANREVGNNPGEMMIKQNNNLYYNIIVILGILLVILIVIALILKKKGKFEMKGKILILVIGILIGTILATSGFIIYNKFNANPMSKGQGFRGEQIPFNGEKPEGEIKQRGNMPEGDKQKSNRQEMPSQTNTI